MRKSIYAIPILCAGLFLGAGLSLNAQTEGKPQIINGDFETWTYDGENLPNHFNSFATADGNYANYAGSSQVIRSDDTRPGSTGRYSCQIWAREINLFISKVIAQGNITTGRVHAGSMSATGAENYNYSDRDGSNTKNGVTNPCAMEFTGMPDSLVVWLKFVPAGNDTQHPYARISCIIHDDFDYIDGFGKTSDESHLVAKAGSDFITKTSGWQRFSFPFSYKGNTDPRYILFTASTNAYPGGGNKNDNLYIDDIELIYNSSFQLSIGDCGWASMCVDFNAVIPEGVTVYYPTEIVAGYARLSSIPEGSVIPANTPVLVKSSQRSVTFTTGNNPVTVSGNILSGVTEDTPVESGAQYLVLSSESTPDRAVFGLYTGSVLGANKAFIKK